MMHDLGTLKAAIADHALGEIRACSVHADSAARHGFCTETPTSTQTLMGGVTAPFFSCMCVAFLQQFYVLVALYLVRHHSRSRAKP